MKKNIVFIFLAIMQLHQNSARQKSTTIKINERIALLKKQIRHSLRNPSPHDPIPSYYESDENAPIKPILDDDELKKNDRFKLAKIKSIATFTSTTKLPLRTRATTENVKRQQFLYNILREYNIIPNITSPQDVSHGHFIQVTRPTWPTKLGFNIFYRRYYDNYVLSNTQEWTHCVQHITPYLKGVKKELSRPKNIMAKDHIVHRLLNLIRANTTKMTRAEKKTTMYQISKLRIRLYSWHLHAIMELTTLISRLHGRSQTVDFLSLKRGLVNMLAGWQADLSNTSTLLRQAKLYRPPCIPRGEQGSSKFVRGSTLGSSPNPAEPFADPNCRRQNADGICI